MNNADLIKQAVTVPQAVSYYIPSVKIRHSRIPCPLHNGTDYNMKLFPKSYYCFVCHETGDVISFVQKYFGIGFRDALIRMNEDFDLGIPIGREPSSGELERLAERRAKAERERRAREEFRLELDRLDREYNALLSYYIELCRICTDYSPTKPWDPFRPDWCEAMRQRDEIAELMEDVRSRQYLMERENYYG